MEFGAEKPFQNQVRQETNKQLANVTRWADKQIFPDLSLSISKIHHRIWKNIMFWIFLAVKFWTGPFFSDLTLWKSTSYVIPTKLYFAQCIIRQGDLHKWRPLLPWFFADSKLKEISKNLNNNIKTSSKVMLILRIWRVWLKN